MGNNPSSTDEENLLFFAESKIPLWNLETVLKRLLLFFRKAQWFTAT